MCDGKGDLFLRGVAPDHSPRHAEAAKYRLGPLCGALQRPFWSRWCRLRFAVRCSLQVLGCLLDCWTAINSKRLVGQRKRSRKRWQSRDGNRHDGNLESLRIPEETPHGLHQVVVPTETSYSRGPRVLRDDLKGHGLGGDSVGKVGRDKVGGVRETKTSDGVMKEGRETEEVGGKGRGVVRDGNAFTGTGTVRETDDYIGEGTKTGREAGRGAEEIEMEGTETGREAGRGAEEMEMEGTETGREAGRGAEEIDMEGTETGREAGRGAEEIEREGTETGGGGGRGAEEIEREETETGGGGGRGAEEIERGETETGGEVGRGKEETERKDRAGKKEGERQTDSASGRHEMETDTGRNLVTPVSPEVEEKEVLLEKAEKILEMM
uniref:Uncharacterized protein n=1 Tax=Chromera velia CCMP2878 TaxID=1169474 RepID=A0A0G4F0U5_9ALVE|eukprot:Cvel_14491.t1-p1 / transcript=Cvel_14491.t1 / gene=Cvel_14491 / organism=Chromera_velia_CCMP2878 / gene_product=hypothetical protein / transcript_product=hypothetical protein / location=Cvel_scaffold1033:25692-32476(+) / protein_length=380 / sequence_SO=supercontig / SO=protein_coding / is_pseudo=false